MNKNRYLLCLLGCGFLLYFAIPRVNIFGEGLEGIFAISWLAFALIVVAGNLSALLYAPRKRRSGAASVQKLNERKRARSFYR